jgi:hypothetical protein
MNIILAAGVTPAGLTGGQIAGLSIGGAALLGGIALGMHRKKKSARIIGWLAFAVGIPLAGLLGGYIAGLTGVAHWIEIGITGLITVEFIHDGVKKFGGTPNRILQPTFGLLLPALLLLTLGHKAAGVLGFFDHIAGAVVSRITGQ